MATVLTRNQYENQFVDFYEQTLGTGISVVDPIEDDDTQDDGTTRSGTLAGVGGVGGEDAFNPMAGTNPFTGGPSYTANNIMASDYVRDNAKSARRSMDKSDSGFFNYMKNLTTEQFKERPGEVAILGAASIATGLPLTAIGAVAGDLNRKKQYENAVSINATGGGNMMNLNGQIVSRLAGSKQYTGTLGNFTSEQIYAIEELGKGYIPGTMVEKYEGPQYDASLTSEESGTYTTIGKEGLLDAATAERLGGNYDAYGNWHSTKYGTVSRSGPAEAAVALAKMNGVQLDPKNINAIKTFSSTWKAGATPQTTTQGTFRDFLSGLFSNPLRDSTIDEYKTQRDKVLANIRGYDSDEQEDSSQPDGTKISDSLAQKVEKQAAENYFDFDDDDDSTPSPSQEIGTFPGDVQDAQQAAEAERSGGFGVGSFSERGGGSRGFTGGFADGGRIGMQAGGTAPAGFVQGPPGQFSEAETVADDQPMEVPEGTFVINAPAVEHAGSQDIRKMILDAYTVAREKGIDIGNVDRKIYEESIDVALSKGEVVIPPQIAKIIGYDRLRKINNRGKKEVSRRQQASEGGFLEQGYASGDKVTVYRGEPIDVDKSNLNVDYGYGKENVGKFHTPSIEKARNFAHSAGPGNQQILSRKVTIDELFDGVEEAWKTHAKQKTDYFKKMPKSELDKNVRFIRNMKKAYETGERSLESMVMFLQEQVFHDDKSKVNFIETFKNDPKSAGKLAGRAISKVATKATPPLAILEMVGTVFAPKTMGDATLQGNESFLNTN